MNGEKNPSRLFHTKCKKTRGQIKVKTNLIYILFEKKMRLLLIALEIMSRENKLF